jgi:feruloyl esterase
MGGLTMYECDPTGMEGRTAQAAPLVVALHGYTQGAYQTPAQGQPQTPQWGLINTSQWATLAQRYHFYVIFPDTGPGARSFYWYQSFYQQRGSVDASAIMSMVQSMQQRHNIDASHIFVAGLSAGAMMTTLMLACYPDVFAGGVTFEGGAFGCQANCAALGRAGMGWTWPGNHPASLVVGCDPQVWNDGSARKPKLLVFQGEMDGAVTPENMADIVQQWTGALGISATPANGALGIPTTLKGHDYTVYARASEVMLATIFMHGIGHGVPVDPGTAVDQGGWDPIMSRTMINDPNAVQDWTNTAGIYGPYYATKFWGLAP